MRFADQLRSRSPEALAALLAVRPDLLSSVDGGLDAVARKAVTPMSLGRCLVRADVGMLVVADALVVSSPATADELDELLGTDDVDAVVDALARLEHHGLVIVEEGVASPVGKLDELLHRPLGLEPSIADLWYHLPSERACAIVEALGVSGARSEEATVRAVARRMRELEGVARLLVGSPTATADRLGYFAAQRSPQLGLPAGNHRRDHNDYEDMIWLLEHGLLVAVDEEWAKLPREVVIALTPEGLAPGAALRPIALRPVAGLAAETVAATAADQAGRALEAVEALLRQAAEGISVRKAGGVGRREIARLAKIVDLANRDVGRLIELMAQAELVSVDGGRLKPTGLSTVWTDLSRARRWLVLARAWIASPRFLSWALSLDANQQWRPALDDSEPDVVAVAARRIALETIASIDDGEAYDDDQLAEAVVWQSPNLWGPGEPPPELLVSWTLDEAELIGLTAREAPTAILVALMDGGDEEAEGLAAASLGNDQNQLVLQSDLSAVALGPLHPDVASRLADLADRASGLSVATYRFSEASIRHAFDKGWRTETIEAFLAEHALSGVPQPLLYLIADVERRYGSVRVLSAKSVVVTDDEAMAVEIATTRRAAKLGLRLIAPTVLIGPVEPLAMLEDLRAEGLFPVLDGGAITVSASGRPPSNPSDAESEFPVPIEWTGPPLAETALPGEIFDAVELLLSPDSESGGPDDGTDINRRLRLLQNRVALVNHLRSGELVEARGVLVGVGHTLTLLSADGIEEVPIQSVISVEDPTR